MQEKSSESTTLELGLLVEEKNQQPKEQLQSETPKSDGRRVGRGSFNANKTQCSRGHDYLPDNTIFVTRGSKTSRLCKICYKASAKLAQKRYREKYKDRIREKRREWEKSHLKQRSEWHRLWARRRRHWLQENNPELLAKYDAKKRKNYLLHREEIRARDKLHHVRRFYGLSPGEYDKLRTSQNGKCAICGSEMKRPHLDHCHKTGKVRGFLCATCNSGVGHIERLNGKWVKMALDYIDAHK